MTPALIAAKRSLRSSIKKTLSSLALESVKSQSEICVRGLLSLPEYSSAKHISVFLSMPNKEIETSAIVENSLSTGKNVYVPYIHKAPSSMQMLSLSSFCDYRSLEPDNWGIPSIPKDSIPHRKDAFKQEEGIDLIVMPGVAFDKSFNRLGHGKGYYDDYLSRYAIERNRGVIPKLVALAFKEQLLEEDSVPADSTDWKVDIILTGDGRCLRR
ncbi:5-formyltetrahydrofolate cyclo-ligase [Geopyxis carbonaria]|nr:5-formyltetrahydrofolate cyclo-ligase [Geopyxis carbonaria]